MPPKLALFLCTAFVLFLLRFDKKQASGVSGALWIPTIWMLSIASKPFGVWFGNTDAEGSSMDRNFLIVLLLIGFLLLIKRGFNLSRAINENIWLMVLLGFMFVSTLWSDIPFISFKRWSRELLAVVMGFCVLTEREPRKALESILKRTTYILIPFSLLLIKYFPEIGVQFGRWSGDQTWVGVTTQKNCLGRLCLISAFFLVWSFIRRWQGRDSSAAKYQTYAEVLVLIMTLWLLKGPGIEAMSATGVTSLAAGLAAFIGLLLMKKYKMYVGANTLMAIIAAVIIFGTVTVFVGGSTVGSLTSTVGRDTTLTGRTEVWESLLPVAMESPIGGSGFGGFWTEKTRVQYDISEAHSGYLDVLLDLGFVGLLLVSIFLLSSCKRAHREMKHDFDWGSLWVCYLLMAVIHNITETSFNSFTSHLIAVLVFLAISSTTATPRSRSAL